MSESTSTTENATETPDATQEAPEAHPDPQEPQEDTQEAPEGDEDGQHPAAEAKKYRLRLRETEAERDALAGQLEAMRRAEAERIAGAEVKNPSGMWAAGTDVADLLDDDGRVDAKKVKAAATAATESLGLAPAMKGNYAPYQGQTPTRGPKTDGMADVISGDVMRG